MLRSAVTAGLLLFYGAGLTLQAQAEEIGLSLHVIDTSYATGIQALPPGPIMLELVAKNPGRLAGLLVEVAIDVIDVGDDRITVRIDETPTFSTAASSLEMSSSFLIDYDEPAIKEFAARLHKTPPAGITELRDHVYAWIDDKTMIADYYRASRVATERRGDCTEHAVLLTALARELGYPARVVNGVLLVTDDVKAASFGHAWTEIYADGRWQLLDATRPDLASLLVGDVVMRYIPIKSISVEGLNYAMGLLTLAANMPTRVDNIRPAAD